MSNTFISVVLLIVLAFALVVIQEQRRILRVQDRTISDQLETIDLQGRSAKLDAVIITEQAAALRRRPPERRDRPRAVPQHQLARLHFREVKGNVIELRPRIES